MEKLTVYVVISGYEYEGSGVDGVFYSKEKAEAVKAKLKSEKNDEWDSFWVTVQEFQVK